MKNNPIGVFDSGIGGLTVVKEIINVLPNERIMYLGDTARVPYGTRDTEIIAKFALQLAVFLLEKNVKALVVACNTISATALSEIKKISPVPVIDVISPTIAEAVRQTKTNTIGIIGTRATIKSNVYQTEIQKLQPDISIISKACPLFVPLAEEGWLAHPATELIAKEYLADIQKGNPDTLILGCTHYPLLKQSIQKVMNEHVMLIDSAHPTAMELKKVLLSHDLLTDAASPTHTFYVTDKAEQTSRTADIFFDNHFPGNLEKITLPLI